MKLEANRRYAVISKFAGEQPKVWDDLASTEVKSTMHYVVSCAADEHAEDSKVHLEYLRVVYFNKRPGRKVLCEVSRSAMTPKQLRRAYDLIMSWC